MSTVTHHRTQWTFTDFFVVALTGFATGLGGSLLYLFVKTGGDVATAMADPQHLTELMSTGPAIAASLFAQQTGHLAALLLIARQKRLGIDSVRFSIVPRDGWYLVAGVALQYALALAFGPLAKAVGLDTEAQGITGAISGISGAALRVVIALGVALVAPAIEELMFRGVLLRRLEVGMRPLQAAMVSAGVFALFHVLDLGQQPLQAAIVLLPQLLIVGLVLARLVQRHDRLGPAIFTHAGFNLLTVLALFFGFA